MKGIVFTEFLGLVESRFGYDVVDEIIQAADLPNDGAYTSGGTYDFRELARLVDALSQSTATPQSELTKAFGSYLFQRFLQGFPAMFEGVSDAQTFLLRENDVIHVEVRKLYPDAELPSFDYVKDDASQSLEMRYDSARPFADLAEGLILACIEHFGNEMHVRRDDCGAADGTSARFVLTPVESAVACPK